MLQVTNCFIKKFISAGATESEESVKRNTKVLFDLFEKVLEEHPKDTGLLKLYGRLISSMQPDNYEKILSLKLREVNSLLTAGWQYDLEQGQKITKTIEELKALMGEKLESNEEVRCFIKNTLDTIEQNKV